MISKKMNRLYVIDCGVILNLLYFRFRQEKPQEFPQGLFRDPKICINMKVQETRRRSPATAEKGQ